MLQRGEHNNLACFIYRGTEGSGLIGSDGNSKGHFKVIKNCGLIIEVFKEKEVQKLNGLFSVFIE